MNLKRITSLLLCALLAFSGVTESTVAVMASEKYESIGDTTAPKLSSENVNVPTNIYKNNKAKAVTAKAAGDVLINATNFPDIYFAAYVYYYFDRNGDLILSQAERDSVTAMYPNGDATAYCTSLKGIEFFTKLTKLQCAGNQLTSLDVSKNKKLTYLLCDDNLLKTLKVPSSLTELYASNNQLYKVSGLDKCKKMKKLDLSKNLFVKLPNMKSFSKITHLSLNKNYLTETELKAKLPSFALASNNKTWFKKQVKSQRKLAKPKSLKVATSGKKKLVITWKPVTAATGYQVYYSTSKNGTYKKAKTTSGTSFTHTKRKKGTTYYYKVRSYKKIGKSKVYSSWTSIKSKKSK